MLEYFMVIWNIIPFWYVVPRKTWQPSEVKLTHKGEDPLFVPRIL
jgi:hypothetical protein